MIKFGRLDTVLNNVLSLDEEKIQIFVFSKGEVQVFSADLNRRQLLAGENSADGSLPLYVDDPFFKTLAAAERYASWKSNISPNTEKPKGVMDFYINGAFHKTIQGVMKNNELIIKSDSDIANSIMGKTRGLALGLNLESRNELAKLILPIIIAEVRRQIFK